MDTESREQLTARGKRMSTEADAFSATAADKSSPVECDEVDVLLRPWLRIDGSLNRRVLDRLLGAVLGQVRVGVDSTTD
jgi:hypothetical protein